MRAIVQRVSEARVEVDRQVVGSIGRGFLVLLGVGQGDSEEDLQYMVDKILNLRVFEDDEGKMNLSLLDVEGEMLVVSQFTLYGDCRKGRRPSFSRAAGPELAEPMYNRFVSEVARRGVRVEKGVFGAMMSVFLCNDGPVTLMIDSERSF
ncbi:MAG: D-aminoacyl-tRNA deacylase [Bacillota bacterium]|nr:D-tyrosyl-tRNA(Tyr) deacylase [Bacillota bacterium]HOB90484.1 D-aminoacyl-tRNA deacylase [Bacillota bacterium]HPZ53776.1 D-aminoacyl-tRNA deacylase [Bacillota bacterium]HQD17284.1 D-aminoacyl-tRNA deacylase [Bacillota bacterium]